MSPILLKCSTNVPGVSTSFCISFRLLSATLILSLAFFFKFFNFASRVKMAARMVGSTFTAGGTMFGSLTVPFAPHFVNPA